MTPGVYGAAGRVDDPFAFPCRSCQNVLRRVTYVKRTHSNKYKRGTCESCKQPLGPTEGQRRASALEKRQRTVRLMHASPQTPKRVDSAVLCKSYGKS